MCVDAQTEDGTYTWSLQAAVTGKSGAQTITDQIHDSFAGTLTAEFSGGFVSATGTIAAGPATLTGGAVDSDLTAGGAISDFPTSGFRTTYSLFGTFTSPATFSGHMSGDVDGLATFFADVTITITRAHVFCIATPFIRPQCLCLIRNMDGSIDRAASDRCNAGVDIVSPFPEGPHTFTVRIAHEGVLKFVAEPQSTLKITTSEFCPSPQGQISRLLEPISNGTVVVTVQWDDQVYSRPVGVVSYQPKVDWQPSPAANLRLAPGDFAIRVQSGGPQIGIHTSTSPSAHMAFRLDGNETKDVDLRCLFTAKVGMKVDLDSDPSHCIENPIIAFVRGNQEDLGSGSFQGNFRAGTTCEFFQSAASTLPFTPFLSGERPPLTIDFSGRGRRVFADTFGPFPVGSGHSPLVAWDSNLESDGTTYDFEVGHRVHLVHVGSGLTEAKLEMPGVELRINLECPHH